MTYEQRKEQVKSYLGKLVTVQIDRPISSIHPKREGLIYPINYGYIPGVMGGDGEELDVYVLGVDKPLESFTGRVIGIIHRENDVEDKLVAAPTGMKFHQAQIAEAVDFQERYYTSRVEALYQKSCGAIVFRRIQDTVEYLLLLQTKSRTWSFPKGHMEAGETEQQTALREVSEETGLTAAFIPDFRQVVTYRIGLIDREVVLFLAEASETPVISEGEMAEHRWVDAETAKKLLYPEYEPIMDHAEAFLRNGM